MLIFKNSLIFLASIVSASDFLSKEVSNSDVQEFSESHSDDRSPTKEFMKQSSGSSSDSLSSSGSASSSSEYVDFDHDENLLVHSKVDEYLKMAEINKEEAVLKAKTEFDGIKKAFIEAEANFQKTSYDSVEAYDNLKAIQKAFEQRQNTISNAIETFKMEIKDCEMKIERINASDRINYPEYEKKRDDACIANCERTIKSLQSLIVDLKEEDAKNILDSNKKMQEADDKLKSLEIIDDKAEDVFNLLDTDYKLISKVHRQFLLTLDYNNNLVDKNQKLCELDNIDRNEIIDIKISSDAKLQNGIEYDHMKRGEGMAEKLSKKIAKYKEIMSKMGKRKAVLEIDRDFKSIRNRFNQLEVNLLFEYGYYRLIIMKFKENESIRVELDNLKTIARMIKRLPRTSVLDEKLIEIETVAIPKLVEILQKGLRDFKEANAKVSTAESDYKSGFENYIITFEARLEFLKSLEENKVSASSATAESF